MFEADDTGTYLTIYPAPARRVLALAAIYALAGLIIWIGFSIGVQPLANIALIGGGVLLLWSAEKMRAATRRGLTLSTTGLTDSDGTLIASWDQVDRVERGVFAMKPSNGFGLKLSGQVTRGWAPGLWWRTRRRVGVGGVLAPREVRSMGEQMAVLLPKHKDGA